MSHITNFLFLFFNLIFYLKINLSLILTIRYFLLFESIVDIFLLFLFSFFPFSFLFSQFTRETLIFHLLSTLDLPQPPNHQWPFSSSPLTFLFYPSLYSHLNYILARKIIEQVSSQVLE